MNEREEMPGKSAQLFTDLIEGKTNHASGAPAEVQDALRFASRLARTNFTPPTHANAPAELRARLLAKHARAARRSAWSDGFSLAARGVAALALFLALAFLFTRLVPDLLPRPATDPTVVPGPNPELTAQLTEAAFQSPFGILLPNPNELTFPVELDGVETLLAAGDRPFTLSLHYRVGETAALIRQIDFTGGEPPMKAVEDVTVRGRPGYWIVFNVGSTGLHWETEEMSVDIIADNLSREDMLAIAESMTVFTPEISLQQAAELFAFPLLVPDPAAMPLALERGPIVFTSGRQGPTLVQSFVLPDERVLNLQQRDLHGEPLAAPAPAHVETSVRGLPGYLIDGASRVTLIWAENGVDTALSGELSAEELQAVADALIPLGSSASFSANPGGQLVYAPTEGGTETGPTLFDFETLENRQLGYLNARVLGWSPSGEFLALRDEQNNLRMFHPGGLEIALDLTLNAMDAFWLPRGIITEAADWLAFPTGEGGLEAIAFPTLDRVTLLPAETFPLLGEQYVTPIFVSDDGWLAWMPSAAEEIDQRSGILQATYVVKIEPGGVTGVVQRLVLSQNLEEASYTLLGWVPGMPALLVGGGEMPPASPAVAGGPLYLLDAETGELRPVDEVPARLTPEAFAWHPTRPGYLALAEVDVRTSSGPAMRLALIDLTTGEKTYLSGEGESAFEPQWSPDGERIAYAVAVLPAAAPEGAADPLAGRAVRVADAVTGQTVFESQPGSATDGWPRFSAGGKLLLYVRQQDGAAELRAADLTTGADGLLLEGIAPADCTQPGGCNWARVIAYNPFGAQDIEPEPTARPAETPTPDPRYSHPRGAQINLAWDAGLSQTVALEIGLFRNEDPQRPYYVTHLVNDPAVLAELTAALDIPVTVGGVPACIAAYELTFRLGNGGAVTFGYGCGPGSGALFRGISADGALAIEGEVMITAGAKKLLDPLVEIAESRRQLNELPRWVSRIEEHAWQAGPFSVEEYLVLDPGPYQASSMEFRQIILDWVFEKREAQRVVPPRNWPIPPVTIGGQEIRVDGVYDEANQTYNAVVSRAGAEIYRIATRPPAGSDSIHGLWAWGESWVLEVDGHVIIDGVDQTEALGAEETFDWQIMGGQPFFFVQRPGAVDISYGGELIPLGYEHVTHQMCCEAGMFNVGKNETMAWFYALKDGVWRYVEMGLW
ncbi:MAG TPA: hypothetical protein VFF68_06885 [Anaerolineaceae bacterium]|nr:hypothetical protein [Anaerolineaceae bacterium]